MDQITLQKALLASISASATEREEATRFLTNIPNIPGALPALLQMICSEDADIQLRLSGAVTFQRLVIRVFRPSTEYSTSDADKQIILDNIVMACIVPPELVRTQMQAAFIFISRTAFPDRMPDAVAKTLGLVTAEKPDVHLMYGALSVIHCLAKRDEWAFNSERRPIMDQHLAPAFPVLLHMLQALRNESTEAALNVKRLAVKCLYRVVNKHTPGYLLDTALLDGWMTEICHIIETPATGLLEDIDERNDQPQVKLRKWAVRVCSRILDNVINFKPSKKKNKKKKPANELFFQHANNKWVMGMLSSIMKAVSANIQDKNAMFISTKEWFAHLQYFQDSVLLAQPYTILKQNKEIFVEGVLLPHLTMTAADVEMWRDEPQEYVRSNLTQLALMGSLRTLAMSCLYTLIENRGKDFFPLIMPFISTTFQNFNPAATTDFGQVKVMDAALFIFGHITPLVLASKKYSGNAMPALTQFVIPNVAAVSPYIRARALWTLSCFAPETNVLSTPEAKPAIENTLKSLADPELPIRVQANLALKYYFQNDEALSIIRPFVDQIIPHMLKVIDETGVADVAESMSALVNAFEEEVVPHARSIVQRLMTQFDNAASDAAACGEDDDDQMVQLSFSADEALNGIKMVFGACCNHKEYLTQLEADVTPVITKYLPTSQEFFEPLMELITEIIYMQEAVSPFMWSCLPVIAKAGNTFAIGFTSQIYAAVVNYITYGTKEFIANADHQSHVFSLVNNLLTTEGNTDHERQYAIGIIDCLVHCTVGNCANIVPTCINIAMSFLAKAEHDPLKAVCFSFICSCFFAAGEATLAHLNKPGPSGGNLLENLLNLGVVELPLEAFAHTHLMRSNVFGLTALFCLPSGTLPPSVIAAAGPIFKHIVKLIAKIDEIMHEEEQEIKTTTIDENFNDDGVDEFEDVDVSDEDDLGDYMDDGDLMNEGLADVFQDELPTDSLDEMQYFAERMSHLGTQNTAEWTAISGAIGQDGIGALKTIVDAVPERLKLLAKFEAMAKAAGRS